MKFAIFPVKSGYYLTKLSSSGRQRTKFVPSTASPDVRYVNMDLPETNELARKVWRESSWLKLDQIRTAVDNGLGVRWSSDIYHVVNRSGYFVHCIQNDSCVGLSTRPNDELIGDAKDFYVSSFAVNAL